MSCPVCVGVIRHHGVGGFGSSTGVRSGSRFTDGATVPISGLDPARFTRPRASPSGASFEFDREARTPMCDR